MLMLRSEDDQTEWVHGWMQAICSLHSADITLVYREPVNNTMYVRTGGCLYSTYFRCNLSVHPVNIYYHKSVMILEAMQYSTV